ncbi:hypothetical protein GCM10028790_10420 [Micromonospora taraxaci]|uniref:Uncharacterized protein n=2 Tax=Micromonospora taraxaci TaxID=1316803 RepID=A0A561W8A9_9ACTN|nr:hypothetical protein FHU34_115484 [Micromonospora taraxaci]
MTKLPAMATPMTISMGGEQRFVAVILAGDAAAPGRLWVCVRGDHAPVRSSWLGCWSSAKDVAEPGLHQFLEELDERLAQGGRSGPLGLYLDEHHFLEGWDSWGCGIPSPLASVVPDEVVTSAGHALSISELVSGVFGSGECDQDGSRLLCEPSDFSIGQAEVRNGEGVGEEA